MGWNPFKWMARAEPEPQKQGPRKRVRNYQAAALGNRLTSSWTTERRHPDEIVNDKLAILRARSREQYANNDYMARFVGMCRSNVVGPRGMTLQCRALSNDGTLDQLDNGALEAAFKKWGKKGTCDVSGGLSWRDMQRLFIATVIIDGEFLAREVRQGPHGYQLALIDPEFLDVDNNKELANGNFVRFSIEFNRQGRPVAYYVRDDALKTSDYMHNGKRYRRYPASEIIHAFIPERIGQKRGIPAASTALMRMNMLDGYEDAAMVAARVGASQMGFFTSPDGATYVGDDEGEDGELTIEAEPGVFQELPEGVGFEKFDPDYPHQQFPEFVKACLRGVASGLGVSYNTLANDLEGVNYSSIRAGVLEDREVWMALQEWMVESFAERVYLGWLGQALALGKIPGATGAPLPPRQIEKFSGHRWQPRRWPWVDPLKDTQANALAVQSGFKSHRQVVEESGRDFDEVVEELRAEQALLADVLPAAQPITTDEADNNAEET